MMSERGRRELREKVAALVGARFGGSFEAAFLGYDPDREGLVGRDGLFALLADAGVGTRWTRPGWVSNVLAELDADADGRLSWPEFAAGLSVPAAAGERS